MGKFSTTKLDYPAFGLSKKSQELIKEILFPYKNKIKKVMVFGSRAMGNYKENSDLDLALYGKITSKEVARLFTLFEESLIPIKIDVIKYEDIKALALKEHIDKNGQIFC